jgi:hypothetical protein
MKTFLSLLSQLGISYINVINGAIGGVVWAVYTKSKILESIRKIFFGAIVSAYVTPLLGTKLNLAYTGFLSFVTGMLGMITIELIYKWGYKKIKILFS